MIRQEQNFCERYVHLTFATMYWSDLTLLMNDHIAQIDT